LACSKIKIKIRSCVKNKIKLEVIYFSQIKKPHFGNKENREASGNPILG
jgi:hypothetical protein